MWVKLSSVRKLVYNIQMKAEIQPGLYRHSKSLREYRVLGVAHHSETMEPLVIYQAQYDSDELGPQPIFARPVEMWHELVEIDGKKVPRFVTL